MSGSSKRRGDFLVHGFTCTTSTGSSCPAANSTILNAGRTLIDQASTPIGWMNVRPMDLGRSFNLGRNIFAFNKQPPSISQKALGKLPLRELKEWGSPISASDTDDIVALYDLPEFENTNLDYLATFTLIMRNHGTRSLEEREALSPLAIDGRQRAHVHQIEEQRPPKRRKLDSSHLYNVIPQPHYQPCLSFECPVINNKPMPPYRKTNPIPVSPRSVGDIQSFLQTLYTRSAWIVPVRGFPPWDRCTPASVLEAPDSDKQSSYVLPSGPGPSSLSKKDINVEILWTHVSLRSFWNFLLAVRNAGIVGPLSLSFHAAQTIPTLSGSAFTGSAALSSFPNQHQAEHLASEPMSGAYICRTGLLGIDHIKIYHEAQYAMYVRNVIDAWAFRPAQTESAASSGDNSRICEDAGASKIRILQGARFALVDQRSKGVLVS